MDYFGYNTGTESFKSYPRWWLHLVDCPKANLGDILEQQTKSTQSGHQLCSNKFVLAVILKGTFQKINFLQQICDFQTLHHLPSLHPTLTTCPSFLMAGSCAPYVIRLGSPDRSPQPWPTSRGGILRSTSASLAPTAPTEGHSPPAATLGHTWPSFMEWRWLNLKWTPSWERKTLPQNLVYDQRNQAWSEFQPWRIR